MKIPFEEMLKRICEHSKLSEENIQEKIKTKMDQLSGLISKEGAAHIIANELGVSLQEASSGSLKLKDLKAGMRDIETAATITGTYEPKEFKRQDGSSGKVASILIADDTGKARIVLWNDAVEKLKEAAKGSVIKVNNPFIKESQYGLELHYNADTKLIFNVTDVSITLPQTARKTIASLAPGSEMSEILATVVQMFEPRYFEVCPTCQRRARPRDGNFVCDAHGAVTPDYSYVLNCVLDDGTATVRTVFFGQQSDAFLGLQPAQMQSFKDLPGEFQPIKDKMLGKIVKVTGRVSKNDMFDRLELVAQSVDSEPSAEGELARLERK